ncbi:hypothetical protein [Caballeronia sp. S22]|uniref:hypothetical protein n=1 Tax=Caballeronia sp. S22 TaxID=3137182 RepID=UPI0035315DA1
MVQGLPPDHDKNDESTGFERWPAEAPTAAIARVVLQLDEAITLKRRAAAAWLTAHGNVLPALPIRPSRMELAVFMALAETYGTAVVDAPRFLPVLDFIAECGAVKLVQRVMYGETRATAGTPTWVESENERFAGLLREAQVAFEFLCGTRPEVFLAQAHNALQGLLQAPPMPPEPPTPPQPPLESEDGERDDG